MVSCFAWQVMSFPAVSLPGPHQLYWTPNGTGRQPKRSQPPISLRPSSCQKVCHTFLPVGVSAISFCYYYRFNTIRIMVWPQNSEHRRQKNANMVLRCTHCLGPWLFCSVLIQKRERNKQLVRSLGPGRYTITNVLHRTQFVYEEIKAQHI